MRSSTELVQKLRNRVKRTRDNGRRRFARPIDPAEPAASGHAGGRVEVFIASLNTCVATEMTVRSLKAADNSDYEIVVGDGGSTDGSVAMLEDLASSGTINLICRDDRWRHHEWIDWRIATSDADHLIFCDSDMEFRRPDAVSRLVATARRTGAALVAAELCRSGPGIEPVSGEAIKMAVRPSAWLFLVIPHRVREIQTSFAFAFERVGGQIAGGKAFDTGAAWFADLRRRQIPWAIMPGEYTRCYHHHAGLSWRPLLDQEHGEARSSNIQARIRSRVEALRDGRRRPTWQERARTLFNCR